MNKTILASALAAVSLPSTAEAAIVINVTQVGPDVVVTGNGTFDTAGLTKVALTKGLAGVSSSYGVIRTADGSFSLFSGLTGPTNFGVSALQALYVSSSNTGDVFGISGGTRVYLPSKYVSGEALSATSTYANQTFASLGLTLGSYVYQSANDTLTLNIGVGAVPEPATWAMMLVGFGMVGAASRYRRRSVKVSPA